MKSLVLYHASCADGFTSAWAAWKVFGDTGADYLPVQYGGGLPEIMDKEGNAVIYENVYILDFSFNEDEIRTIADRITGKVIVLDHHRTAEQHLAPLVEDIASIREVPLNIHIVFDMEKSGAMLSWEHFHPGVEAPLLVQYVQDLDLWHHKISLCHEVRAYSATVKFDFEEWSTLADDVSNNLADITIEGAAMLKYRNTLVGNRARNHGFCNLDGHILPCVNDTNFGSEVGNALAQEYPAAVIFFVTNGGKVVYSLRSAKENPNHIDVSELAKKFGGGGHKHASGFRSSSLPLFVAACGHEEATDEGHCALCGCLNVSVGDVKSPSPERTYASARKRDVLPDVD